MISPLQVMMAGESYWRVHLTHRIRELSELDIKAIQQPDGTWLNRRIEWLEDLIGSGDIKHVTKVTLITPRGVAALSVLEPYTVFQLSRGTCGLLGGHKIKDMQLVGVVTDKTTGDCEYALWDVLVQQLYRGKTNVHNFHAWRPGVIPLGALNLKALEVRDVGGGS